MKNSSPFQQSIPERIIQQLCSASNSCTLEASLEALIEVSKSIEGRSNLASQNILPCVLELIPCLIYTSSDANLLSSLKVLRNLCAGEIRNQNVFIEQNGIEVVLNVFQYAMLIYDPDRLIIRLGLQVLANVSLAGEEHQQAIWCGMFPDKFVLLARIRYREISDPLSMIIYLCSRHSELLESLCGDLGLPIIEEIIRTTSSVGFSKDWVKLLLSRICLEEPYFPLLFSALHTTDTAKDGDEVDYTDVSFSSEQAFLLTIISEILNEQIGDISVSKDFASYVYRIFQRSISVINSSPTCECSLPTGTNAVDVLGYSLIILRDICAQDGKEGGNKDISEDAVNVLLSLGLIDLLLGILRDIKPPAKLEKALQQVENKDGTSLPKTTTSKLCPYKGFRRDVVSVIGNCCYRRKQVQDDIRVKDGVFVLLQQCVVDENNPFLREWGIWAVRNLLEGNEENKKVVSELEVQGPANVSEIAELGLQVQVDPKTRRAKLVNASRSFKHD